MTGASLYIIGALAFLFIDSNSALSINQANSVCALLPDTELIANPLDCSQYYSCKKGAATLNTCLGNYLFSKEVQSCLPPSQTSCGSSEGEKDPCANMPDGYFVAEYNSCSGFYYCQGGIGTKSSCQNGLNFDQANQACKYESEYPCKVTNPDEGTINICEVVRSGIYFGSSTSCNAWQKCQLNGPPQSANCPSPYIFNVDTQACDYKDNYVCRQTQEDPSTGESGIEGTACQQAGEVKADTTCAGYYVCTGGKYAFGKCINGQYFNPATNQCVGRLDAINNCDRCEGTKLQFVNLYQDDCKGYAYCQNGKTKSTGECPTGYFDEVSGSCIVDGRNPEYPVCYKAVAVSTTTPTEVSPTTIDTTVTGDAETTAQTATITDSTTIGSTITASTTVKTDSTPDSTPTSSKPNDSTIADSTIADSTIADSTIADSTIADSTIADSTIADSTIADSTIADSTPNDSSTTDSISTDSTIADTTTTKKRRTTKSTTTPSPTTGNPDETSDLETDPKPEEESESQKSDSEEKETDESVKDSETEASDNEESKNENKKGSFFNRKN